jgi:hypothetical protein
VSKGDEIMPAIKTLKLLAHGDSRRPSISSAQQTSHSLTRTSSSINTYKTNPYEKNLTNSKSLRILSSRSNGEQSIENKFDSSEKHNDDSEQQQGGTDDGDS